ncbi:MAG: diadenosine tetraphosphate (Ap4A) HIT family hydrolase [Polaribacter sp.]|jgi:diadenosine tetraphosphate (Ap4A) HIT family hydrolase
MLLSSIQLAAYLKCGDHIKLKWSKSMSTIHPQLLNDSHVLGYFPLCHLLLENDASYPWFILVPKRENISEIYQLSAADQQQLMLESSALGEGLMAALKGDKLNVAALGNIVPQLHVHVIVRYKTDAAWPGPVWGKRPAKEYDELELIQLKDKFKQLALPNFTSIG